MIYLHNHLFRSSSSSAALNFICYGKRQVYFGPFLETIVKVQLSVEVSLLILRDFFFVTVIRNDHEKSVAESDITYQSFFSRFLFGLQLHQTPKSF